ncbi:MAG: TA0938 family protein [Candidatus Thermoplasmatota archaeon]|nr:TA0938 family protein [Candidatus Thermoplasmatota archaeon]
MKRNYSGCALCDATWGDYHRVIEGENMFFCCSICADAFENAIDRVKNVKNWKTVDEISISGNYSKGRKCVAKFGNVEFHFFFRHEDGRITEFREIV